ncbi:hypothetical protein NEOLEDRAFT_1183891 [Neolentinus lepideus HHB14362 ss-1]|uniref:Uncharacterized protein n=1 Tax=Neolentinus lepideus HHB14362 ss-1 TaxID=1314782 RepID=A0A165MWN9_9AGAM|nr:hypothetical protein NEOLEDRAFT_1183891 [Neolentinus lepideus HHB14362 ss-1]
MSSPTSSSSLRAAIQEVADALARHDFEESSALYALAGLVPVDGSTVVRAAREWEYAALCLELLPLSVISELRRCFPGLPWSLIVMPPSTEEVPPSAEELPPVEEEEEVVAPVATHTTKGKGKAKAIEESRPEKVPCLRAKRSSQQIEVGPRNERPCDHCVAKGHSCYLRLDAMPATACFSCKLSRKGCSLSAGVVSNAEHLRVDAERHSAPSGSRARVRRTRVEIVDEGENAPPSSPEVAPQSPSRSSGGGLPALDTAATTTWSRSRRMAPVVDNAEAGPSKSTPVGEKRPHGETEGMPPFKRVCFQVPEFGSQVFDANNPSQLLGVVASIPTQPPPPPSAPSASEDRSLQERVMAMEVRQAHLEARIGALEYNSQVFQAWVAVQQYENQAFRRALDAQASEFQEMVAALTRTIDQDRSSTARELQRGRLFQSTAYPTLHLAECYFLDHPLACASPLEDYPVYSRAGETEERTEAAHDHEPAGEDGGEDFGEWCDEEETEEEEGGLNDDERDSVESTDRGSYGEPEDAEREDSRDECDRALEVDEDESDDSSSSVDLSEEEANALIANAVVVKMGNSADSAK